MHYKGRRLRFPVSSGLFLGG